MMSAYNVKMDQTEHFRKYNSIVRMGHRDSHGVLKEGDMISVWEKLDGSNASFKRVGDEILAFSRNLPLNEENNLNGFYQWTQTLDVNKLTPDYTYYGEWLVPHKVVYGDNARQFYLFDVWMPEIYLSSMEGHAAYSYGDTWEVVYEAEELGINLAPLLYVGPYRNYAQLEEIMGRSVHAEDALKGEGIVIKNHAYRSKHGTQVWLKMVSESFAEVQRVKKPRNPNLDNEATRLAREATTPARVQKAVDRLIEQQQFDEDNLDMTQMGALIPIVGKEVCLDIVREEAAGCDEQFERDVYKTMGKLVPPLLRKIIEEHERAATE